MSVSSGFVVPGGLFSFRHQSNSRGRRGSARRGERRNHFTKGGTWCCHTDGTCTPSAGLEPAQREWGGCGCVPAPHSTRKNLHGCQPVQTGAVMIKTRTTGLITSPGRVLKGYSSSPMMDAGTAAKRRMPSVLNLPSARHIQRDEPGCDGHA